MFEISFFKLNAYENPNAYAHIYIYKSLYIREIWRIARAVHPRKVIQTERLINSRLRMSLL